MVRGLLACVLVVATIVCDAAPARAAKRPGGLAAQNAVRTAAVQTDYRRIPYVGAISAGEFPSKDGGTNHWRILTTDRADATAYPASVTKLMTALLVLEDVAAGRYALTDRIVATPEAYHSEASWVGIKAGQSMTVDDLLMSLLVKSANDAAIVLGVKSAGSLDAFVERMNARALELGMANTRYFNPNGLPPGSPPGTRRSYPWKEFNRTTAADQLRLAIEVVRHPEVFRYTSTKVAKGVVGGDGNVIQPFVNHNNILVKDKSKVINPDGSEAVDGLKTGYIDAGGSSIVLTGTRKGRRAIVVVLGSSTSAVRDERARTLLEDALDVVAW